VRDKGLEGEGKRRGGMGKRGKEWKGKLV